MESPPVEYGLDLLTEYGCDGMSLLVLGLRKHRGFHLGLSLTLFLACILSLSLSWVTSAGGSKLSCCKQPSGEAQVTSP